MDDVLQTLVAVSVLVFAVSSMLSVGLSYSFADVLRPLRNVWVVVRALIANFVLVPLLALGLIFFFSLESSVEIGLLLLATGAGAPFLIKLTKAAEGDVARSATLLVVLTPVTVLYMPLVLPRIVANGELIGLGGASIPVASIAWPLVLGLLVPLGVGLVIRALLPRLAERGQPPLGTLSTIALITLVVALTLANLEGIAALATTVAPLVALLFVVGAYLIGFALAGRDRERRVVIGLGTGQRNVSAATVVGTQAIGDPDTLIMVVTTTLVGLLVLFPIAALLRKGREGPWLAKPWGEKWGTPIKSA